MKFQRLILLHLLCMLAGASTSDAAKFSFDNGTLEDFGPTGIMASDDMSVNLISNAFVFPDLSGAPTIGPRMAYYTDGQANTNNPSGLGLDNPTISDADFSTHFGSANEKNIFNHNESWNFEFDRHVRFDEIEIEFSSLSAAEDGEFIFNFISDWDLFFRGDDTVNGVITDPFNGWEFSDHWDITAKFRSAANDASVRNAEGATIRSFTVTVTRTPEPSSTVLLGWGVVGAVMRRRARAR